MKVNHLKFINVAFTEFQKKKKKRLMITNLINFTNSYNQLKMKKI